MNKERRKAIEALKDQIRALATAAAGVASEVEALRDEEQDYFDNIPESLQSGDRGQASEAAISSLEYALSSLEDIETAAEGAIQSLDDATA